jgi:predicted DNA-binding transcriptional regulator AlpA
MPKTINPERLQELLDADQSATVAGVARRTWWRYVSSGRAPEPIRVGGPNGPPRWRRSDLLTWIDAGCPRVRKAVSDE